MAAIGGEAEGIYVARLWRFLTNKDVKVSVITDSSSCRAFSEKQGVGRLKHIDAKFVWLQQRVNENALTMDAVSMMMNVTDMGTKELGRVRRAFLMYLMGMVFFDETAKSYSAVGEEEFNE